MSKFKIEILGNRDDNEKLEFGLVEFFIYSPCIDDAKGYAEKHAELYNATVQSVTEVD